MVDRTYALCSCKNVPMASSEKRGVTNPRAVRFFCHPERGCRVEGPPRSDSTVRHSRAVVLRFRDHRAREVITRSFEKLNRIRSDLAHELFGEVEILDESVADDSGKSLRGGPL